MLGGRFAPKRRKVFTDPFQAMEDSMLISKMTINDYPDVYNLWITTKGMGLNNIDDSKDGIEKYLKRNPDTCFVARENNELIGVIISGHDGRRGFIYHTSVKESERNKGIGKDLLKQPLMH
jgi:ribosomal protein S18 acetylase RimI-like enzyme